MGGAARRLRFAFARPQLAYRRDHWRAEETDVRTLAWIASIVVGAVMIVSGIVTWVIVSNTLADQKITVSQDASCLGGDDVNGPFSAYCQAKVIDKHSLEATGGKHYAELAQDDPLRQTAMTASFLQASLFTSVVAYGTASMAILVGILFILIGLGIKDVARALTAAPQATPVPAS